MRDDREKEGRAGEETFICNKCKCGDMFHFDFFRILLLDDNSGGVDASLIEIRGANHADLERVRGVEIIVTHCLALDDNDVVANVAVPETLPFFQRIAENIQDRVVVALPRGAHHVDARLCVRNCHCVDATGEAAADAGGGLRRGDCVDRARRAVLRAEARGGPVLGVANDHRRLQLFCCNYRGGRNRLRHTETTSVLAQR